MFAKPDIPSLKHTGQERGHVWDGEPLTFNAQKQIHKKIRHGKPPLEDLEKYRAFFDMEFTTEKLSFESFKHYEVLYEHYPDAKFLFNCRDKFRWLRSRALHQKGTYLTRTAKRLRRLDFEALNVWMHEFDRHMKGVREFFADKPGSLCEYDIDKDPIEKVMKFAGRENFRLQRRFYRVPNVSGPMTARMNENMFINMSEVPGQETDASEKDKLNLTKPKSPENLVKFPGGKRIAQQ